METNDLHEINADFFIDASWHLCPAPILMTEEKIKALKLGQILELLYTDPGVKPDLQAWCRMSKNELLGFREKNKKSFAYIQKGKK